MTVAVGSSSTGVSILLVDQKLAIAHEISERLYVMGHGQIVFEGKPVGVNLPTLRERGGFSPDREPVPCR